MEDIRFTSQGWHWKITPEQIEKIKQRDRDTVNQVYFDNLEKFKRMAFKFCGEHKLYSYFKDCVQQIYADMLYYDYSNSLRLFCSIRTSFYRATMDSVRAISLDEPIFGDDIVLADRIGVCDNTDKPYEDKEQARRALEIIARQTHLPDSAKDFLTACAFDCLCYKGIFDYEYKKAIIA